MNKECKFYHFFGCPVMGRLESGWVRTCNKDCESQVLLFKIKAKRTDAFTKNITVEEIQWCLVDTKNAIRGKVLYLIGGPTGYEAIYVQEYDIPKTETLEGLRKGWVANIGSSVYDRIEIEAPEANEMVNKIYELLRGKNNNQQ